MQRKATQRDGQGHKPTVLVIVGDTPYAETDGRLETFAALAKQLDLWCAEFDQVRIAAHRVDRAADGFQPLASRNVELIPLRAGGGSGLRAKLGVATLLVGWLRVLVPLLRGATAVHLRTPCNVTLLAIPLTRLLARRRYAIFAGTWEPSSSEPKSYRLQRGMLRHFGGVVHAYVPPDDALPDHIRPNVSPSFTAAELDDLAPLVHRRLAGLRDQPPRDRALRICCVGTFTARKNQAGLIRAARLLLDRGVPLELRFAGTGRTEAADRALADDLGLGHVVTFEGQLSHTAVRDLFAWADVNALVTFGEGFGKVFVESMAVGCPVVCGSGRMQGAIVGSGARGRQADPADVTSIAAALEALRALGPDEQAAMTEACLTYARTCTLDAFATEVHHITRDLWDLPAPSADRAVPALEVREP